MLMIQADPFPGRCKNLRPAGYEMLRCLESELVRHVCRFPEQPIRIQGSGSITTTPMSVKPWVVPK
jgi:hypothetical protein